MQVLYVQVWSDIKAPDMMNFGDFNSHTWLVFSNVDRLIVNGIGQIDGIGKSWWDSCPKKALAFNRCNNLQLSGLRHVDNTNNHISITNCVVATISNIHITAPKTNPYTDGIDISNSTPIQIHDSYIGTGDDCIAMINGCKYINITGVNCGPGHGISIGSLGKNGSRATVEELHVNNCTFNGTQNGARIKTWQGGSGYAKIISFVDIILIETDNPILIDQYYCPHDPCKNELNSSNGRVSNKALKEVDLFKSALDADDNENSPCSKMAIVTNDAATANVSGDLNPKATDLATPTMTSVVNLGVTLVLSEDPLAVTENEPDRQKVVALDTWK
ncbi:probable polygalacturonase At3g15720 [Camellia sinensis]|uniref:probable polygalacturonase At3g15720 n=1 Tax=Camellia sinensis TaxID=4442 RepID=UPI00103584FE|nr:probable polygalacturonase At3g15720 [Camellia sinensis]